MSDQPESGVRHSLIGGVLGLTVGAIQTCRTVEHMALKDDLDATIKASLAYVMCWLRRDWIPVMRNLLSGLSAVDEDTFRYFKQRVTPALCDEFFHCTDLLASLEISLLQLSEISTVDEQGILSLKQLLVDLRNRAGDLVEVTDANHCLAQFLSRTDGGNGSRYE
jgi:hypothetical protein